MNEERLTDLIHISEIDEYLALRMIEQGGGVLGLHIEKSGDNGYVALTDMGGGGEFNGNTVDFELSPTEYQSLEDTELSELLASSLITSSALELFDFLLLRLDSFRFSAEFTGSAWKIRVGLN